MEKSGCLTFALLLALALGLMSCTYPDEGYYALAGVNRSGERVSFHPFMINEITDDTDMTTDFVLFWPRESDLIVVKLDNSQDLTRRQWTVALDSTDSGAGTIVFDLIHSGGKMYLAGDYQPDPRYTAWPLRGEVVEDPRCDWLDITTNLPPLPDDMADVTGFDLVKITQEEFEDYLGQPVSEAKRLLASPAMITHTDELPPEVRRAVAAKDKPENPEEPPEPVGGRESDRPR